MCVCVCVCRPGLFMYVCVCDKQGSGIFSCGKQVFGDPGISVRRGLGMCFARIADRPKKQLDDTKTTRQGLRRKKNCKVCEIILRCCEILSLGRNLK